ncbi:NAC domain-containing protein [Artemisia annua]|uniref:NAC domain-containing protein n=1 Tax=Artemisia annua TaxID=35608 RepID=A0A2U1LNB4_ARTAN|nr:NAC domain-containing protein [Artemisia annua]
MRPVENVINVPDTVLVGRNRHPHSLVSVQQEHPQVEAEGLSADIKPLMNFSCFLKPKFKITGKKNSGKGWFYKKVNVYDYSPDDLTEEYESCDNKWYFLTSRERKHLSGKLSHQQTRNIGTWKATRKDTSVCDDVTERVLGRKRCLVYLDKNKRKTPWLMHEYTLNDPIIPFGSRGQYNHKNKMTDWVLCKIYKKETKNQNVNINMADQVQNMRNTDEPSPTRRKQSVDQENNHSGTNVQTEIPVSFMLTSKQWSDLSNAHVGASATQSFQFSSGASSSSSMVVPHKDDGFTDHVDDQDMSCSRSSGSNGHQPEPEDNATNGF